jgi:myosin-crossreactive antigen
MKNGKQLNILEDMDVSGGTEESNENPHENYVVLQSINL